MRLPNIIRGPMTEAEKERIEQLARAMKTPKPGPIAVKLNRHPATIKWYMLRHGLIDEPPRFLFRAPICTANGVTRHPWTPEQDKRLEELLVEHEALGLKSERSRAVAEALTKEFGVPRNPHSVRVRAVMLAAAP